MWEIYLVFVVLLLILTVLPKIPSSHWIFRVPDFGKIQITYITLIIFIFGFFINSKYIWYYQALLLTIFVYHGSL